MAAPLSPFLNQQRGVGEVSLITALLQKVRTAATGRPLLLCVDGLAVYLRAARSELQLR